MAEAAEDAGFEPARAVNPTYRPAGGSWSSGTVCEEIVMDAANFCLIVCGRPGPDGGQPWAAGHPDALLIASGCAMHIHRIGDVTVLNDDAKIRCHGPQ
jgi:hypothetical protein